MIVLGNGPSGRMYKKAVFVWTGHKESGWALHRDRHHHNDPLIGCIAYGHDFNAPDFINWFVPFSTTVDTARFPDSQTAAAYFQSKTANRPLIWMNSKDSAIDLLAWTNNSLIIRPEDLGIEPVPAFATQREFAVWADPILDVISSDEPIIVEQMIR